ncbi:MAG: hypothetical protein AB7Q27_21135 [Acidimicrobiia bacterium]
MASTTAVLVRGDDISEMAERFAVGGFLAGNTGHTLASYTTDLRLFTNWCTNHHRSRAIPDTDIARHRRLRARSVVRRVSDTEHDCILPLWVAPFGSTAPKPA